MNLIREAALEVIDNMDIVDVMDIASSGPDVVDPMLAAKVVETAYVVSNFPNIQTAYQILQATARAVLAREGVDYQG